MSWQEGVGWFDAAVAEVRAHASPNGEVRKDGRLDPAREAFAQAAERFVDFAPQNDRQTIDRLHNLAWVAAWQTWIARTLGEARGFANAALAYIAELRAAGSEALTYLVPQLERVQKTAGWPTDLAPQWGADFLRGPSTARSVWWLWLGGGLLWLLRK